MIKDLITDLRKLQPIQEEELGSMEFTSSQQNKVTLAREKALQAMFQLFQDSSYESNLAFDSIAEQCKPISLPHCTEPSIVNTQLQLASICSPKETILPQSSTKTWLSKLKEEKTKEVLQQRMDSLAEELQELFPPKNMTALSSIIHGFVQKDLTQNPSEEQLEKIHSLFEQIQNFCKEEHQCSLLKSFVSKFKDHDFVQNNFANSIYDANHRSCGWQPNHLSETLFTYGTNLRELKAILQSKQISINSKYGIDFKTNHVCWTSSYTIVFKNSFLLDKPEKDVFSISDTRLRLRDPVTISLEDIEAIALNTKTIAGSEGMKELQTALKEWSGRDIPIIDLMDIDEHMQSSTKTCGNVYPRHLKEPN